MTYRRSSLSLALTLALATALALPALAQAAMTERQQEVMKKGEMVMPFDLTRTHHIFDDTATGGVQTVVANRAGDSDQIALIRMHLRHEAMEFSRGDFADPGKIHGNSMPGLAALRAGAKRMQVTYAEVPSGAKIVYRSEDPALVRAVHDWFAAQRSDHAAAGHAMHGM